MGRYIAQSDVENLFGQANVRIWSNIDNHDDSETPNATRITAAIAYAEDMVDDRLRDGPFSVPVTGTIPTTLKDICARLAGVWLYEARGVDDFDPDTGRELHKYEFHRRYAMKTIDKLIRGEMTLNSPRTEDGPTAPVVIT